jgi:hypothetical protein
MSPTPLAVLDLLPLSSGSSPRQALDNTVHLVARAEEFGYERYWFAEHHLNPGVLGASPAVEIALAAGATARIRLGSAGVQSGHRTPLAIVEEFGLLDARFPGRLDLGIGRSIGRPAPSDTPLAGHDALAASVEKYRSSAGGGAHESDEVADNGLLLPKRFDFTKLIGSPRLAMTLSLLQQPGAYVPSYEEQISDVLNLLEGNYRSEKVRPFNSGSSGRPVAKARRWRASTACGLRPRITTAPARCSTP